MPFRKPNSKYWKIRRKNLPGYGDSGTLSTRTTNKAIARAMERLIEEIAEKGLLNPKYHTLLDALRPASRGKGGELTLPDLLKAKNEGRLPELIKTLEDPTLEDAVQEYLHFIEDEGYHSRKGVEMILDVAPKRQHGRPTRLTYLRDPKHIMRLCRKAEQEGGEDGAPLKRNTVRRYLYTGISKMLRYHLGAAERDRIFAEVDFPAADDARELYLSRKEIIRFLDSCRQVDEEIPTGSRARHECVGFYELVHTALLTSADRSPLLRLKVRDVRIARNGRDGLKGVVYLDDRKTDSRPRSVAITDRLCRLLLPLLNGKDPDERVFLVSDRQLQYRFEKARERAGLEELRFKDLRHQFGIYANEAKIPISRIQRAMGHGQRSTTLIYTNRDAMLSLKDAERIEREMGLGPARGNGSKTAQNRKVG